MGWGGNGEQEEYAPRKKSSNSVQQPKLLVSCAALKLTSEIPVQITVIWQQCQIVLNVDYGHLSI